MIKVTAYCRVSSNSDEQRNSLENQEQFFLDYIRRNPDWEYVSMYVDEGLSGTSVKKRANFIKMMDDAHEKKFDLILTKEVSRFSRNTMDTLRFTRELKEIGVGVIFINDNIDTRISGDEFRLTIMASVAQEEVRKISERVKWGQTRSMESGVIFGQKILGYSREGKNKLRIIPDEAQTVKLIFQKYLNESKGLAKIARELEESNTKTAYGKTRWDATGILRILKNEKYCGDLKQKKFITPDYLTHKTKRNKGEEKFIIIPNNHPPIISREIFDKTQSEIIKRGAKTNSHYTNRYVYSGKLKCGFCGANIVSRNSVSGGKKYKRWHCANSMKYGKKACSAKMIAEQTINTAFLHALDSQIENKEKLIKECTKLIELHNTPQINNHISAIVHAKIFSEQVTNEVLEKIIVGDDCEIYFKETLYNVEFK
ncbi:MAG: recombinase family protein [Defluviitaleaceae bacterium]|nr:recombinase family protein [Defluviitaleaceae bacterium]